MKTENADDLVEELSKRYKIVRELNRPSHLVVGVFGVPYASFHEYGTKWSAKMRGGFFRAVKDKEQRSPTKNVMEFAGRGKVILARLKARPFMRPAFEQNKNRIFDIIASSVGDNPLTLEQMYTRIGSILEAQIVRNARNPPRPEKGARGPIADSGALLQKIRYEIRR